MMNENRIKYNLENALIRQHKAQDLFHKHRILENSIKKAIRDMGEQ